MVPLISITSLDDVAGVCSPEITSCPVAPFVAIVVVPVVAALPIVVLPLPEVLTFTVPVTDVVDDALPIVVLDVPVMLMLVPPVMVVTPAIAFVAEALPMVVVAAPVVLMFVAPVIEPPELPVIRPVTTSEPPIVALPVRSNVPVTFSVLDPDAAPICTRPLLVMRSRSRAFVRMTRGAALFDPKYWLTGSVTGLPVICQALPKRLTCVIRETWLVLLMSRTSSLDDVTVGRPPRDSRPVLPLLIATPVVGLVLPIVVPATPVALIVVVPRIAVVDAELPMFTIPELVPVLIFVLLLRLSLIDVRPPTEIAPALVMIIRTRLSVTMRRSFASIVPRRAPVGTDPMSPVLVAPVLPGSVQPVAAVNGVVHVRNAAFVPSVEPTTSDCPIAPFTPGSMRA